MRRGIKAKRIKAGTDSVMRFVPLLVVNKQFKIRIMKTIKILALQKKVEELSKEIIRLNNLIKK